MDKQARIEQLEADICRLNVQRIECPTPWIKDWLMLKFGIGGVGPKGAA